VSHRSLGDGETEFLQFGVNAGLAPRGVFFGEAPDQSSNILGDLRLATARPGPPTPVQAESGAVPGDRDDDENIAPARPQTVQRCPEEPVAGVQFWPRPFTLENRDLLAQGEDFDGGVAPAPKEDA
jgi:hypothetical protein